MLHLPWGQYGAVSHLVNAARRFIRGGNGGRVICRGGTGRYITRGGRKALFPDMPCMKRTYRDKKASAHWSAARNEERPSSRG